MIIQFATQSYKSDSLPISSQRVINCYAEMEPKDAKTQVAVKGVPGMDAFAVCGSGPVRGLWTMAGVLYAVSGQTLYSISSAGVVTSLGGAVTGTSVVSMADNGTQLCIVNGTNGYIWSQTGGFQLITNANFYPSANVTFFDDYFVFNQVNTNKIFISAILDGTTYNGLNIAAAEVQPSYVLATVNQQENLLIFTQKVIETWYDTGAVTFPFQRINGGTIERGCASGASVVKEDNSVFFLGDDGIYYRLNGISPTRISTHAIEAAWETYPIITDAVAFTYTIEGHKMLHLFFPSANASWEFDIATNLWHERISWDMSNNNLGRWRANCHANAYNNIYFGDAYSGTIGQLDVNTRTEFGNIIQWQMVSSAIHSDRKRVFFPRLELDFETGIGLTTGQGSNPQVMLDWSDDEGRTYKPDQIWQSIGPIGTYQKRLKWTRLGSSRDRRFRITISDPVVRNLVAANADITVGM